MATKRYLLPLCVAATVLAGWAAATYSGMIPAFFLPTPSGVLGAIFTLFTQHGFAGDVWVTAVRIAVGFVLAVVLAVPLGMLIGLNKDAEYLWEPVVDFIRYVPIPAAIPLFILWFGIGEGEKVTVIVASVFFQLVLMVANAVAHTPAEMMESARTLGAGPSQVVRKVVFPLALPRIVDDMRVCMGWAWSAVMIAEVVGANAGIGAVIVHAQRLLQTANVMAAVTVVGTLGILTDFAFKRAHRRLFPWVSGGGGV